MKNKLYGSIEAGGTKFVCAVGNDKLQIIDEIQIKTTYPEETLGKVVSYFNQFYDALVAISIGSFGPIDNIKSSSRYGYITSTPKKRWQNTDVVGQLTKHFDLPIYFTTDVNASAYGEAVIRKEIKGLVYFTIGTGIGAGIIQNGVEIGTIGHTEFGHIFVAKHSEDANFTGVCPIHGDCLEGLASGPSLKARTGYKGEQLEKDDPVWEILAYYIAQAAMIATLSYRPEVIVLGGGVMSRRYMLKLVREKFLELLNNYVEIPPIEDYIVLPIIKNNGSATIGNFCLAKTIAN